MESCAKAACYVRLLCILCCILYCADDENTTSNKYRATIKKVKNVSMTGMGDKVGRIHMKKQDLNSMGGRHMKVLRSTSSDRKKRQRDDDGPAITEDAPSNSGGRGRAAGGNKKGKRARSK